MKHLVVIAQVPFWFLTTLALAFSQPVPFHLPVVAADDAAAQPMPAPRPADCPSMCGDVHIPYPFGIGGNCAWSGLDEFTLICNRSFSPPRPYLGDFEVMSIALDAGEMRVVGSVSYICYNSSTTAIANGIIGWTFTFGAPFLVSQKRNAFTAIGCHTLAYVSGGDEGSYGYHTGCITSCQSLHAAAQDGDECTGLGCCQTSIPANISRVDVFLRHSRKETNPAWRYSPCSYAFVAEKSWYHFRRRDLTRVGNKNFTDRIGDRSIPLVLDWAIRSNGSCHIQLEDDNGGESAKPVALACVSANSHCVNATQGSGYLCRCSKGYKGNPYFVGGCTRTFVASVLACLVVMEIKRRKQKKFFDKNGGEILKSMGINIFTERQLKKITNRYSTPIGEGAFGKVFMGIIDATQRVAVKRSRVKGEALRQEDFVNEITIQFRISHANLVRLVGCCLETNIPMLVFEFVPNESLYNVLHGAGKTHMLLLPIRLDIALGSAQALAYMHSHGSHNHVHGDVKSGNILLDENLTPKVSDFGSSKLVSIAMHANWSVAGDMNYIDPVYIKTGRFTEKSDVYSFGVVLLELITRKTAKYDGCRSLPIDFVMSCKDQGKRRAMYDRDILCEDGDDGQSYVNMECLDRVGELAVRCLKEDVEERPTMVEVVEVLKQVKSIACRCSCSHASYETCTIKLN
ncbi:unnamed protein product [Miscanthus lutarioriparius]|uniref:Protein kinase domain-containing protein n=1 Tax=Miscanthus lutarioriparius TaxID=422564 RepID=A0A811NQV0_9POAL|nr:unnamed protein product [Miscanthus lutarioriparius]